MVSNSSESSQRRKLAYSVGFCTSLTQSSTLTMPRPSASVRIQSFTSSAGSPKNSSPPSFSSGSSARRIAATDCVVMLPYFMR